MQLKKSLKKIIKQNDLVAAGNKVLLAVSGGPDSLAMLELFCQISSEFAIEIAVAHFDHQFREESAAEAEFVKNKAAQLGVEFYLKTVDLPALIKQNNLSAETAAREARFKFFRKLMIEKQFDLLALAHHQDDQAETVLLNLFRGSGLQGLGGIDLKLNFKGIEIIHPLLYFSKEEILNYCRTNNLQPCFDSSNQESIYSRNIIRNQILPLVEKKLNPQVKEVIARNAEILTAEDNFLNKLALTSYQQLMLSESKLEIALDLTDFKKQEQVLQRRILRLAYQKLNNNLEDLYLEHILEIEKLLLSEQTGRGIDLPGRIRVEISYDCLVFIKVAQNLVSNNLTYQKLSLAKIVNWNKNFSLQAAIVSSEDFEITNTKLQAAFDLNKLELPLFIRSRKSGDRLQPLGMKGEKKVKDILIDAKVPLYKRDQLPIIVDSADNIIWVAGYKMANNYKITKATTKILVLNLIFNQK